MRYVIGIDLGTTYSAVAQVVPQSGVKTIKAEELRKVKKHYTRLLHPIASKRKGVLGSFIGKLLHAQYAIMKHILSIPEAYKKIEARWILDDEDSKYIVVYDSKYTQVWHRLDVIGKDGVVPQLCFNGELFNVPLDYDKMLTGIYGKYMELPPIEKRVSGHDFTAYYIG